MLCKEIATVYFDIMRKLINSLCRASEECLIGKTGGAYLSIHVYICKGKGKAVQQQARRVAGGLGSQIS